MSSTYTLHVSALGLPGDPRALERAELVRDGFSWGACLAPMLWFFWHRHWLTAFLALGLVVGLAAALWAFGARPGTILLAEALLHILFGLEGASLRRFAYERRGRPVSDVVLASDAADAEAKSFARWLSVPEPTARPLSVPPIATGLPFRSRSEPVIGLFPDAERRR